LTFFPGGRPERPGRFPPAAFFCAPSNLKFELLEFPPHVTIAHSQQVSAIENSPANEQDQESPKTT
jgi:hypothetical protein